MNDPPYPDYQNGRGDRGGGFRAGLSVHDSASGTFTAAGTPSVPVDTATFALAVVLTEGGPTQANQP